MQGPADANKDLRDESQEHRDRVALLDLNIKVVQTDNEHMEKGIACSFFVWGKSMLAASCWDKSSMCKTRNIERLGVAAQVERK